MMSIPVTTGHELVEKSAVELRRLIGSKAMQGEDDVVVVHRQQIERTSRNGRHELNAAIAASH